jgi:hypothetical protein
VTLAKTAAGKQKLCRTLLLLLLSSVLHSGSTAHTGGLYRSGTTVSNVVDQLYQEALWAVSNAPERALSIFCIESSSQLPVATSQRLTARTLCHTCVS